MNKQTSDPIRDAWNDGVIEMNRAGEITAFDSGAEKMFRRAFDDVKGKRLADVIAPSLDAKAFDPPKDRMGARIERSLVRSDGTNFSAEIAIAGVDSNGARTFVVFIHDIEQRKQIEETLRDSEERFRLLVAAVKEYAIFMLDAEGRVTTWNAGAEAASGYAPDEILGQHFSVFYSDADRSAKKPDQELRIATAKGHFEEQGWRVRKDGTQIWTNVLITSVRDASGTLLGFAKVTRDLTERRKIEAAADRLHVEENGRMQESNRLKSEFLANMSHELRTPLNAILGFAELMFKGKVGPMSADHKEYLGDILTSAQHLLQLINNVLDLAKVESGKMEFRPEDLDLRIVIAEVSDILRGLASTRRVKIVAAIDPTIAHAVLDPSKLKQVLYNYLSNALKFTPENGQVTIRVLPEANDCIRIEVEDTGIGIRPEDLSKLFVEFQQLDAGTSKKYPGTGLGLSLTKGIVVAQGGTVGAKSEFGKGATFWAALPRRMIGGQVDVPAATSHPPEDGGGRSVVVVDDSRASLRLMEATLATIGCTAMCFADPSEALRSVEKNTPALVVLDVMMGEIDGFAMLDCLRAIPAMRGVPIVVWTVKDLTSQERSRLLLTAQQIVPKGKGDSDAILEVIRPYLDGTNVTGGPHVD